MMSMKKLLSKLTSIIIDKFTANICYDIFTYVVSVIKPNH